MLRELPCDYTQPSAAWLERHEPLSDLEALMCAAPGEPDHHADDTNLRHAVSDALQYVSPQTRFIIEAKEYEGITYRELALRLGVTHQHAHRLHQAAMEEMRRVLIFNPTVRERIGLQNYWQNHAEASLISFVPRAEQTYEDQLVSIDHYIEEARMTDGSVARGENLMTAAEYALGELVRREQYNAKDMVDLLAYKQSMYGHRNILDFGINGVMVRMADKRSRLENIAKRKANGEAIDDRGESELDTLTDLVGYGVIVDMILNDTFETQLEPF